MLKLWVCLICLALPLAAHAKLYKIIDDDGVTTYTDIAPSMDAKEYKLKGISAVGNPQFNMKKFSMVIPYTEKNGSMIVQGMVNNVAIRFVVDTGATLLAIPPSIAEKAGLYKVASQKVTAQTANGAIEVSKVNIKTVMVHQVSRTNLEATIQPVSTLDPDLGLLGMNFFHRYKMTIDHKKREIQLEKK